MDKKQKTSGGRKKLLYRMTFTAVFAALAVVVKSFTNLALNIPGIGIKIGFSGIFTFFPAIFCGPVWGGVASALSDALGYAIAPDGAYIPWLTLTAFCGGVIKGLLWRALNIKAEKRVRIALVAAFAAVGIFGAAVNISLVSDGVMSGVIASQQELPLRGQADAMELSPLSRMTVSLAKYNKDTITLTSYSGDGTLYKYYDLKGYRNVVTKIGKDAFAGYEGELYIPETYKTIDAEAGGTITLIKGAKGSAAEKYASDHGIPFEEADAVELTAYEDASDATFKSSDGYRKNLASYINLLAPGLELAGIVGILFVVINLIAERADKSANGQSRVLGFVRIAVACVVTGVVITTVNTFILREVLAAWQGRAVLILLIPRVAEEVLSCILQAYIISLLFGIIYRGKLRQYINKIN